MDHKTPNNKLSFARKDKLLVGVFGVVFLLITVFVFNDDLTPEWAFYQEEFRDVVSEKLGPERAAAVQSGLQQIYVKELNVADRCITCHQGVEWKGLENSP